MSKVHMLPIDDLVAVSIRASKGRDFMVIVDSLRRHGYQSNKTLIVSKACRVIDGVRRVHALRWLRANDAATYNRVLPTGEVPVVYNSVSKGDSMLVDVAFDCLCPRVSTDPQDQYWALMGLPDQVEALQRPGFKLAPLSANILRCGEWVVWSEWYLALVWLKKNRPFSFKRHVPDGLVTVELVDGPRFSDRPCIYLTCV